MSWYLIWFAFTKNHNLYINRLCYHQFTTSKDKMSQNNILAMIFDLWQGLQGYLTSGKDYKDKSCPCKEKQGTRIRFHPCIVFAFASRMASSRDNGKINF